MESRVASRYARAIFNAANKAGILESVSTDLNAVADLIERDTRFRHFVNNPQIGRVDKLALFENVFSDRVTALTMSLVRVMMEKGREDCIEAVRDQFSELKRAHDNVLAIKISSAAPLDIIHKEAIIKKIETATKQKVEATLEVDESLLGGVKVEYGGYVMDGSVSGTLARLKESLVYDALKQV
ncbi:MAG: ATP synthase F1 subunit delta [Chthonomonas sp.]|nr:ATP synthase F1 subunit delta [Chthonomonas sp.]